MATQAPVGVIGRDDELAVLRGFLAAPERWPSALLVEGEAGIGKTTLWRAGIEAARELPALVLTAAPAEAEAKLSFAAIGDLLESVLDDAILELPAPQRRALEVALLRTEPEGPPPDQRAIALGFLGAIRVLARKGRVVVAVDDVQWLDAPSSFVLEFTLRRLRDEPVGFLFALRAGQEQTLGLERALPEERLRSLPAGPLSLGALHHLLNERLRLVLSRPKVRRLYELSGGNPFYALELGRALQRGTIRLEPGESLPSTLGALVEDRLAALPNETRAVLLVASALSQPTLGLVACAAGGDPEERLAPALEARVVELDEDRILFSHPLLASGAYANAGPGERRALHRRLAHIVPDSEEHARHLALGAKGPDPDVAGRLDAAARRAHARGAMGAAAELADLALRLTPVGREEDRHQRAIQAADHAFAAGESGRAKEVLEEALASTPAGSQRARVLHGLGGLQIYDGNRRTAVDLFRRALAEAGDDLALRAQLEDRLASALFLMRTDLPAAARHAQTAVAIAEKTGDVSTQVSALAEQGLIEALIGRPAWRVTLERGISLERQTEPVGLAHSSSLGLATNLTWADELDEARAILRSLRDLAEERAEESALPWILANLSLAEFLAGRWAEASRYAQEANEVASQTGQEPQRLFALGARALVWASQGELEGARADAEATLAPAEERGVMIATILASSALGLVELSLGRPDAVHRLLGPLGERLEEGGVREPGSARFLPDDIEALIGLGHLDEAEALVDRLEQRARRLDRASALAAAARCRGLLAASRGDLDSALAFLEGAISEHERAPIPFDQARTLLTLGSTRRRARMKRPAREALKQALAMFEELGARVWAEKVRAELARIGGRPPATGGLTPTEERIAELAAEGRTDKEIAADLFLTPKTVGTQLSRIYRKVGVRSRTELAGRLRRDGEMRKV
jgi:DNA-binding CsgD family transcriptional regulator